MTLSPPFRLLSRALAAASLIATGLVLPGTVPTADAATCGTPWGAASPNTLR